MNLELPSDDYKDFKLALDYLPYHETLAYWSESDEGAKTAYQDAIKNIRNFTKFNMRVYQGNATQHNYTLLENRTLTTETLEFANGN